MMQEKDNFRDHQLQHKKTSGDSRTPDNQANNRFETKYVAGI